MQRVLFSTLTFISIVIFVVGCNGGKGLTSENMPNPWTLEMYPHPDTIGIGVNDTIFIFVRENDELRSGIKVTFEQSLGESIPEEIYTVINDPEIPWGTQPMATFISRHDAGVATIYGIAHHAESGEILVRDTIRIWVVENP